MSDRGRSPIERFVNCVGETLQAPVIWFRETVVEPNRKTYPWYHEKVRRVPTIDQCYTDDVICEYEANQQFRRDKMVDNEILSIIRQRFEDCAIYEAPDSKERCKELLEQYNEAAANWFTKYGDLGAFENVKKAYMKQKHRMIWERRHGPVGSGMRTQEAPESAAA